MPQKLAGQKRTPIHQWHVQRGARLTESDGWRLPSAFTSVDEELGAARSGVGLADVSALAKLRLGGSAVPALTRRFVGNGVTSRPGRVFTAARDNSLLGCALAEDQLLVLAATTDLAALEDCVAGIAADLTLERHDATSALAGIHVIGPSSEELLCRLTTFNLSALTAGSCAETNCAGIHATLVRDPDWALAAVRVYVSWDFGEYLWETLFDAGRSFGIVPIGIEAWRMLANGRREPPVPSTT